MRSYDVARRTARILDDPALTADAIASSVSVRNESGSDVVSIAAQAPTPAQAAENATAYRREFTFRRQEIVRARARDAIASLREVLSATPVAPKTERNTLFGAVLGVGLVALRDTTRSPVAPVVREAEPERPRVAA